MNSLQLAEALQSLPLNTMVYAANRLPNSLPTPCGLIVNTDPDYKAGSHWIGIYIDKFRTGEYFDSFGFPPNVDSHLKFLRSSCRKWSYNTKGLQSYDSTVCGQYCLLFLYFRAKGFSMSEFLALFSNDSEKNDSLVRKMFKELFKPVTPIRQSIVPLVQVCCCRKS